MLTTYYGSLEECDIANGIGVRVTLFVSGCRNHCKDCFQPQTWDFCYGQEFTKEVEDKIISLVNRPFIRGLTLLGGDPMEPENQAVLLPFLKRLKEVAPEKDIWCFTGYTWEMLHTDGAHPRTEHTDDMLSLIDVLVDGPFVAAQKNIGLQFRGSENQRIILVQESLAKGELVPWVLTKKERTLHPDDVLFNHLVHEPGRK